MDQSKYGIEILDETGISILEIGPHVIREAPKFSEKIGIIAASWAHAEVNLNCLFAILLNTTPEEASIRLKKYGSAAKATDGARKIATDTLQGAELEFVLTTLTQLDAVRAQRNRVQHDVWAKKGSDKLKMFAIHSNEYLAFVTKFFAITEKEKAEEKSSNLPIMLAMEFAKSISNGYTIKDLQDIDLEINSLSKSLQIAMFTRLTERMKNHQQPPITTQRNLSQESNGQQER